MTQQLNWQIKTFDALSSTELYDIIKLRIEVFVVEQDCIYQDLDDLDKIATTRHVFAYEDKKLIAYCRVLAPDVAYKGESAIGRVIIANFGRGRGLGYQLIEQAIMQVDANWPNLTCHLSAQQHLHDFYQHMGFEQITDMYLEDGIPHIGMRRQVLKKASKN